LIQLCFKEWIPNLNPTAMNLSQNLSITFRLNYSKKNAQGLIPIWCRITIDGRRAQFSTSQQVLVEHWDKEESRVNKKCPLAQAINETLEGTNFELRKHYHVLLASKEYVTAEDLKKSYKGEEEKVIMFFEMFEQFHQMQFERMESGEITRSRYQKWSTLLRCSREFVLKKYKKKDMPVRELRLSFVNEFYHHLRTVNKMIQNSAMKKLKDLKQLMDYAVMLEYIPSNPFQFFKCSFKKTLRTRLTSQEVERLASKEITVPRLSEVRDCYLFVVYTGFSYKQLFELEPSNVQIGIDGRKWIIKNRSKSNSPENVPLLPQALAIIERYKKHPYCLAYNKLLPVNSNQNYNAFLKEVAIICGVNKNLTSHTARHTFATTTTLENGVPLETVSKMLGHTDIKSTQVYAEITDTRISEDTFDLHERIDARNSRNAKLAN
jgi:site-specific recombinase XerD